jgi:hypothetical protein
LIKKKVQQTETVRRAFILSVVAYHPNRLQSPSNTTDRPAAT